MKRAVALVAVLVIASATALLLGGPLPPEFPGGPADGDAPTADGPTAGGTTTSGTGGSGTTGSETTGSGTTADGTGGSDAPYAFTIASVEKCGSTCRDVTATLENTGSETRRNVRVTTKVYADDDLLWTGNESVGTLDPSASHTTTKRVEVGMAGGMKIKSNDGYVTIVTVVRSESGTTTFSERRKVA